MVLAGLSFSELNAILKENGYTVVNDDFWESHNRIILKKDNEAAIILQFKEFYKFTFVVKFLTSLGITSPEHCQKPYDQYMDYLKGNAADPTKDPES